MPRQKPSTRKHLFAPEHVGDLHVTFLLDTHGRPYDPAWLVELVREQWSDLPALQEALAACTRVWPDNKGYCYMLGLEELKEGWTISKHLRLHHPQRGTMLLALVKHADGHLRIGGLHQNNVDHYIDEGNSIEVPTAPSGTPNCMIRCKANISILRS